MFTLYARSRHLHQAGAVKRLFISEKWTKAAGLGKISEAFWHADGLRRYVAL